LTAIAEKAIERQIGARGLRAVLEETMTKIMFEIPSDLTIRKVIITPECVAGSEPTILRDKAKPRKKPGIHS
jgi:ATP-dependent Clp protease ATP-binding subunit ClpX